jgi:hypothetical protein
MLDGRQIRERKIRVGVRAEHGSEDAALDEIPQVIFAEQAIARQKIPLGVELTLQRVRCRNTGKPAEIVLTEYLDAVSRLGVQVFRAFELVALLDASCAILAGRGLCRSTEPFGAHDQHGRLRSHIVSGGAPETDDERAGVFAAE